MRTLPLAAAVLALTMSPWARAQVSFDATPARPAPTDALELGTPDLPQLSLPAPFATGCGATVGLVGGWSGPEITDFLTANGLTVLNLDEAAIAGGALESVSAIYILRDGMGIATSQAAVIDAWIRDGGLAVSEFVASLLWYDGGAFDYLDGTLVDGFYVPSGFIGGNNTIVVDDPDHPLASELPPAWDCSGQPQGVFTVFEGIDPQLCVVASVSDSDRDGDGIDDPTVAAFDVDLGAVIIFYSGFADWPELEDPRVDCDNFRRTAEDEALLLNALCRGAGCTLPPPDCADCESAHATVDEMEIDREGLRKSFHSQLDSACRALERGQLRTAGNILCALLNHLSAQDAAGHPNKHVSHESAVALEGCLRAFAEANGIPLGERCGSVLASDEDEM